MSFKHKKKGETSKNTDFSLCLMEWNILKKMFVTAFSEFLQFIFRHQNRVTIVNGINV